MEYVNISDLRHINFEEYYDKALAEKVLKWIGSHITANKLSLAITVIGIFVTIAGWLI